MGTGEKILDDNNSTAELQARVEQFEQELQTVCAELAEWYRNKDTDSLSAQRANVNLFHQSSDTIKRLANECIWLKRRLILITGESEVTSSKYTKGPYDFYSVNHKVIDPETRVEIRQARSWRREDWNRPQPHELYAGHELHIGDFGHEIPISVVAQILNEGGRLISEEIPEAPEPDYPAAA